jgi:pyridine nucleotide-disulfide oxidoreductase family protein
MKRLLLIGGGHAHVHVLRALAREPLHAAEVMMISPHQHSWYSGMLPGLLAGHYDAAQCRIDVQALAQAAGLRFEQGRAVALNAAQRYVQLADGRRAEYDILSLNTGPEQNRDALPGAREHPLWVRPIEAFVGQHWPALLALAGQRPLNIGIVGGGAAGVEIALALAYRLRGSDARISLVAGPAGALATYPPAVQARGVAALRRWRVTVLPSACLAVQAGALLLEGGTQLACDAPIIATGATAAAWLQGSGLQLDSQGFVATGAQMNSLNHAEVFAAGDMASRPDAPHPRSGVHAVRAGPALAHNLRQAVGGAALRDYAPPLKTLNLISCGNRRAIMAWGDKVAEGRLAWWWKDAIDRAFIRRFSPRGRA